MQAAKEAGPSRGSTEDIGTPDESEISQTRSSSESSDRPSRDPLNRLLRANRIWSDSKVRQDPSYFSRLCNQQSPEYLWIGCSDSRVPANVILGLDPGEVFVQRNVGNQATHCDLNCMSCLEYAVKELKVKNIIVCGHYNCGAVKAALALPSKTPGLVNCWISDIREARNQHRDELMELPDLLSQTDRLCELNVLRQTFHVCTSAVVQTAWDRGQELRVYGLIYSLKNGLIKKLVGPIGGKSECDYDLADEFAARAPIGSGSASRGHNSPGRSLRPGSHNSPARPGRAHGHNSPSRHAAVSAALATSHFARPVPIAAQGDFARDSLDQPFAGLAPTASPAIPVPPALTGAPATAAQPLFVGALRPTAAPASTAPTAASAVPARSAAPARPAPPAPAAGLNRLFAEYDAEESMGATPGTLRARMDEFHAYVNTKNVHQKIADHVRWSSNVGADAGH